MSATPVPNTPRQPPDAPHAGASRSPSAIDDLLTEHLPLVQAVARRSFPALAKDADLLQSGRIGLWRAARRWDGQRAFPPFACACIHHEMSHWIRTLQRWAACPAGEEPVSVPGPEETSVSDLALYDRIRAAWPRGSRERFILTRLADGVPKAQLAAALGCSTWNVTRAARRAWSRLPRG